MTSINQNSVFEYQDYKRYVLDWIAKRPLAGRGEKSRIAESIHCQLAYVSQIFSGSAQLSLEQAEALNGFLNHSDDEAEYFLQLVQLERAGTPDLRKRIKRRIKEILQKRLVLKNRLQFEKKLNNEDQMTYYSAWYYAAIHMALAIPEFRSRNSLARAFGLRPSIISKVLDFFVERGLAEENKGEYRIGDVRIHLDSESPMISKHHLNWRMQAMQSLEKEGSHDLHYSSVITVSEADLPRVRETLVKAIESVRSVVRPSVDETLFCYSIDLFQIVDMTKLPKMNE